MDCLILRKSAIGKLAEHISHDDAEKLVKSGQAVKLEDRVYDECDSEYQTKEMKPKKAKKSDEGDK
jgi:hypothetical protein